MTKKLNLVKISKSKEKLFKKDLSEILAGAINPDPSADPGAGPADPEDPGDTSSTCDCASAPSAGMDIWEGNAVVNIITRCSCSDWAGGVFTYYGFWTN